VYARVANFSRQSYLGSIRLVGDDRTISTDPLSIAAGGETELTWAAPANIASLRVEMAGDDGLPLDDSASVGVARARPLAALIVSGRPAQLERALGAVPGMQISVVAPAEYASSTRSADLTIFDGFLPPEWPSGAVLAINPPPGNPLLDVGVQAMPLGERELRLVGETLGDLSLTGVSFGSTHPLETPAWATPLLSADEIPLILRGEHEGREIAIWNFDLAAGNLPTRLAFPLLMARTVRNLAPPPLPESVLAGTAVTVRPDPRTTELRLTSPDGAVQSVPAGAAVVLDTLRQPGIYRVEELRGEEFTVLGLIGVNAGSATESNLAPQPLPALNAPTNAPGGAPQRLMSDIWPWLALAAVAVLAVEWLYVLLRGRRRAALQRSRSAP